MRYFLALYVFAIIATIAGLGFRGDISRNEPIEVFPDMDRQNRYKPQAATDFFADGRQDRPDVPGAVATFPPHLEGQLEEKYGPIVIEDTYLATGKLDNGEYGNGIPLEVTGELLDLGHERYNIYCSRCHGINGDGDGITKQYGMTLTPTYHDEARRKMSDGQLYDVIRVGSAGGKGLMGPYGSKLNIKERWAVVAYVRALQLSQNASIDDVPEASRKELQP